MHIPNHPHPSNQNLPTWNLPNSHLPPKPTSKRHNIHIQGMAGQPSAFLGRRKGIAASFGHRLLIGHQEWSLLSHMSPPVCSTVTASTSKGQGRGKAEGHSHATGIIFIRDRWQEGFLTATYQPTVHHPGVPGGRQNKHVVAGERTEAHPSSSCPLAPTPCPIT